MYNTIKQKLIADNLLGNTNQEICDILNNEAYIKYKSLTSREVLLIAAKTGALAPLIDAKTNMQLPSEVRSAVLAATMVLERDNTELDISDADIRESLIPGLVLAGVLTQNQATALIFYATTNTTWSKGVIGRDLHYDDILNARSA